MGAKEGGARERASGCFLLAAAARGPRSREVGGAGELARARLPLFARSRRAATELGGSMSAGRAKKVKMATKSCPECDQQVRAAALSRLKEAGCPGAAASPSPRLCPSSCPGSTPVSSRCVARVVCAGAVGRGRMPASLQPSLGACGSGPCCEYPPQSTAFCPLLLEMQPTFHR